MLLSSLNLPLSLRSSADEETAARLAGWLARDTKDEISPFWNTRMLASFGFFTLLHTTSVNTRSDAERARLGLSIDWISLGRAGEILSIPSVANGGREGRGEV